MNKNYELPQVDSIRVEELQHTLGLSRIVAHLLVARGVDSQQAAYEFLHPSLERDWHDPLCIPGMAELADEVERAIRAQEKILIFGDFDADGISACAVLMWGLRDFGAQAVPIIPLRLSEGYGLSELALQRVFEQKPQLLVTVDNGISAAHEVELALEQGLRVAITDHHEPGDAVPKGVPVCDPKLQSDCPSYDLAGVGVALKLVQVLGARFGKPDCWRHLTDLATLGTVADQMPLLGENRALVADGIMRMKSDPSPAISAFVALSNRTEKLSADALAFSLLPRINSAGRMGDPLVALDLLLAEDLETALHRMETLEQINTERRVIEAEFTKSALALASSSYKGERALVLAAEDWHEGIKGIVASRLVSHYKVPTILFSIKDGVAHGSGRSIGSVNLFRALEQCSDCIEKFGGHAAAVGVTLELSRLDEFKERLCEVLSALPPEQFVDISAVDMEVLLDELSLSNLEEIKTLAPFGQENRLPVFIAQSVFLEERKKIGNPAMHFSCRVNDGRSSVRGIYFHPDNLEELTLCEQAVDVVFNAEINEYRGNKTAQLMIRDILLPVSEQNFPLSAQETDSYEFLDSLFARSESFLDSSDYAGITDADSFHTKVAGVTFEGRQELLRRVQAGAFLELVREPANTFDANAIAVVYEDEQLGYLNARLAEKLSPAMDGGVSYEAVLCEVTGGEDDKSLGANILVSKATELGQEDLRAYELARNKEQWMSVSEDEFYARLTRELIGANELHSAQKQSLEYLRQGHNTLTVMATGRGKSLIFHLHAAHVALKENKTSVFVFPLRALVADQAYCLERSFERFGLEVCVLTGETADDERDRIFDALERREIDCVLTTPEFLTLHAQRFARAGSVGFVVVDEAHHIGMARAGNRPAYAKLAEALVTLGNPLVSAVTATADDEIAQQIISVLSIKKVVCDPAMRENLAIDDERDIKERETRLAQLVASGTKSVIYVNSREQTIRLARMLRKRVPQYAQSIAFYNAGLTRQDRIRVEQMFRDGSLKTIVSTSAFGEGVNIPDIAHVVLYHLPFNEVEFNQMAGRAGRNGKQAHIHLMFGKGDARINEKILMSQAPSREALADLYRALRAFQRACGEGEYFACTNAELADRCKSQGMSESAVSCGIAVFKELGLLKTTGYGSARRIMLASGAPKVELTSSIRYLEGCGEIEEFTGFKAWVFDSSADALLGHFNKPILPKSYQA